MRAHVTVIISIYIQLSLELKKVHTDVSDFPLVPHDSFQPSQIAYL